MAGVSRYTLYFQVGIFTILPDYAFFFIGFLDDLKVNIKPMIRLIFLLASTNNVFLLF